MSDFHRLRETELDGLINRINDAVKHGLALSVEDMQLLLQALAMLTQLQQRLSEQDVTLHKLRKLAGIVKSSEKLSAVLPKDSNQEKKDKRRRRNKLPDTEPSKPVIHERCKHGIELEKGQICPECERGKLYKYDPALVLRVSGQTPLKSTQHILERLRCNACGTYFTATLPDEVTQDGPVDQQYGYSARALMGVQKYFGGAPFYRQQSLQQLFGMPVSASTVFDQCEGLANAIQPLFNLLKLIASQAWLYLIDDTTNRILNQGPIEKPDRRSGKAKMRSGIYTSGAIVSLESGHQCVLYQTNIGHAGEWLDELMRTRPPTAPPPMIMSDALSRNWPSVIDQYQQVLCNAHARREFVDVAAHFPTEVEWVLERYALIWQHDTHCQEHKLSAAQRLSYHQQQSLPVMQQIRDWGEQQLDSNEVEANSGLGKAIRYFLRHYEGLTAFCRIENAPIDNNLMEQALKLIIRGRKNSLFFKTQAGADIADVITSVIATAYQAQVNVFEYLIVLQRHQTQVRQQPQQWLPWTYEQTLKAMEDVPVEDLAA